MNKLIFLTGLLILNYIFFTPQVSASDQFKTEYDINYIFNENGQSEVINTVSLTNIASGIYPSSYDLIVTGDPPKNISGFDSKGVLKIITTQDVLNQTNLHILFNHISAGLDKTQKFVLKYQGNTAVFDGFTWNINLPSLSSSTSSAVQKISLTVPLSFGQPQLMTPPPTTITTNTYHFSSQELTSGVKAVFGSFTINNFQATFTPTERIQLPSDTANQKIFITKISPPPDNVIKNETGQWQAIYQNIQQIVDIKVYGFAYFYDSNADPIGFGSYYLSDGMLTELKQLKPKINWTYPHQFLPLKINQAVLSISNPNIYALSDLSLSIPNKLPYPKNISIPPYGHLDIPISFSSRFLPPLSSQSIDFRLGTNHLKYNIPQTTYILWYGSFIFITFSCFIALAALATKSWHLYLQKQSGKHHLRR